MNLRTINRIPVEHADWCRIKSWCWEHGMTIGELMGALLREWMERKGLR